MSAISYIETDIPVGLTCAEYRRRRIRRVSLWQRFARALTAPR
jgi:hypothetical protein